MHLDLSRTAAKEHLIDCLVALGNHGKTVWKSRRKVGLVDKGDALAAETKAAAFQSIIRCLISHYL